MSVDELLTRGFYAAAIGDTVQARELLRRIRSGTTGFEAVYNAGLQVLEAWIEAEAGHWSMAAQALAPLARPGNQLGSAPGASSVLRRWLAADAFERAGRADSAAFYLELALRPAVDVTPTRGIVLALLHQRLILLYARMGRLTEARQHWEILERTVTRPDARMQTLMAEARAALGPRGS
jgi:hypothetical protein